MYVWVFGYMLSNKSLHTFSVVNDSKGDHSALTYGLQDPATGGANNGTFMRGQDFDSYSVKSGELLQGYNVRFSNKIAYY